jgi:hypothetical protein
MLPELVRTKFIPLVSFRMLSTTTINQISLPEVLRSSKNNNSVIEKGKLTLVLL